MNLSDNFLIIVFLGIIVLTVLLTLWFVYLLKLHRFAKKEILDAEKESQQLLDRSKTFIVKSLDTVSVQGDVSLMKINEYVEILNKRMTSQIESLIQKQNELLGKTLETSIDKINNAEKKYLNDLENLLFDAEKSILSHIEGFDFSTKERLNLFDIKMKKIVEDATDRLDKELSIEIDEYKRSRIEIIDNIMRKKIRDMWKNVLRESESYEDSLSLINQAIVEFDNDFKKK